MLVLEIIGKFIFEQLILNILGVIIFRINNFILRLRGVETKSVEEFQLEELKKRYEYERVSIISDYKMRKSGSKGVVLELINHKIASIEFEKDNEIEEIPINKLLII